MLLFSRNGARRRAGVGFVSWLPAIVAQALLGRAILGNMTDFAIILSRELAMKTF
jgi:hypothetical protein